MMGFRTHIATCMMVVLAAALPAMAQQQEKVDCDKILGISKKETYTADATEVHQCILRGYDPPTNWKRDKGESAGVRVEGSSGFSYGSVQAPEAPQKYAERGIKASAKRDAITKSCTFPPKISFRSNGVTLKGACYDWLNGLMKDKDGGDVNSGPPPPPPSNDSCPIDTDTTKVYGEKKNLTGGSIPVPCGGMVPLTTTNIVLNANADAFANTQSGSYYISYFKKGGNGFAPGGVQVKLPTYLCQVDPSNPNGGMVKSVDLTPPITQVITYNASSKSINVRLKSRAAATAGFIPPYNPKDPEKYLVIPILPNGQLDVPPDCSEETAYYKLPEGQEDINIETATENGCPGFSALPAYSGGLPQKAPCPGPNVNTAPGYPSMPCADYNALLDSCNGGAGAAATVEANCDPITIYPKDPQGGTACEGKVQTGVLNRSNFYYPPGSNPKFYPIQGRTDLMAETVDKTDFYTQGQAIFKLSATAPTLTFNEGGQITMKDNSILIMKAPATVTAGTGKVVLGKGGQLVSSGGTQLQGFEANATYTIPGNLLKLPMEISVGRSVTFPAGFIMPTMPKVGNDATSPYLRLPADPAPPSK